MEAWSASDTVPITEYFCFSTSESSELYSEYTFAQIGAHTAYGRSDFSKIVSKTGRTQIFILVKAVVSSVVAGRFFRFCPSTGYEKGILLTPAKL
jgi:hypothetical protein